MTRTETGKGQKLPERDFDTEFGKTAKNYAPKVLQVVLGAVEAEVIQHFWHSPHAKRQAREGEKHSAALPVVKSDGYEWVEISQRKFAAFTGEPKSSLFNDNGGIVTKLEDMGLVVKSCEPGVTARFRVDTERLRLLLAITYSFYGCKNEKEWQGLLTIHGEQVRSFQYRQKEKIMALFPGTGLPSTIKSWEKRRFWTIPNPDLDLAKKLKAWLCSQKGEQKKGKKVDGWRTTPDGCRTSSGRMAYRQTGSKAKSVKENRVHRDKELLRGHTSYVDNSGFASVVLNNGLDCVSGEEGKKELHTIVRLAIAYFFDTKGVKPETIAELTATLVRKWRKDFGDCGYQSPGAFLQAWADFTEQCVDVKRGAPAPEPKTIDELWPHPHNRVWKAFVLAHEDDSAITADK